MSGAPGAGGEAAGDARPDPMMQEIMRLRAANQAAAKENSRLRADVADREFESQQLDKTIRKLERKIEALEDANAKKQPTVAKGFLKPAPADFQCPPPEPQAAEQPRAGARPWENLKERGGKGVIIDSVTGEELNPKEFWPEDQDEEQQNMLLRKRSHLPEAELMQEMQHPIQVNPDFDSQRYAELVGEGKKDDAEDMIRKQGGPTLDQMQRAPLEVLRKHPTLDPNWSDPQYNNCSLLQWACSMGFEEVASELLERRADPNHTSSGGMTALASACSRNWPACAQLLLERRASPDDVVGREGGQSLLMWASRVEYCDEEGTEHLNPYVAMLLRHGVSHGAVDGKGKTALIHASTEGNVLAVQALLEARADVDIQDAEGSTAWQIALKYCHGKISSLLLPRRKKAAGGSAAAQAPADAAGTAEAAASAPEIAAAA